MNHYSNTIKDDLFFDEKRHKYFYRGKPVPGVTKVIDEFSKQAWMKPWVQKCIANYLDENLSAGIALTIQEKNDLIAAAKSAPDRISKDAADVGTMAHKWIELHIKDELNLGGDPGPMPEEPRVLNTINAYLDWEKENDVQYIGTEVRLYSKKWKVAGTLDTLAYINGVMSLLDNKTANGIYSEHFLQAAAYATIFEEMNSAFENKELKNIEDVHIVRLSKESGEFQHKKIEHPELRTRYIEKFNLMAKAYYLDKRIKELEPAWNGKSEQL